jgi:hypothetical protein
MISLRLSVVPRLRCAFRARTPRLSAPGRFAHARPAIRNHCGFRVSLAFMIQRRASRCVLTIFEPCSCCSRIARRQHSVDRPCSLLVAEDPLAAERYAGYDTAFSVL